MYLFRSLTNDKNLDPSKIKAFADDKISVTHKFVFRRMENILGQG